MYAPGLSFRMGSRASKNPSACSAPGSTTLPHEMGHWLDLPHTFYGWESVAPPNPNTAAPNTTRPPPNDYAFTERVARTGVNANCTTSGDFFCGTPPDYISTRWSACNATSSSANYKDPLSVDFTIDASYYMSYSSDICQNKFSSDQMNQMRNAFVTKSDRIPFLSLNIPPYFNLDSVYCIYPDDNVKLPRNKVNVIWNSVNMAEMYHLIVLKGGTSINNKPNFDIINNIILDTLVKDTSIIMNQLLFSNTINGSNNYYYWKVKAMKKGNSCEDYGAIKNFRVAAFSVDYTVIQSKCKDSANGAIYIQLSGGTSAPYLYESNIVPILTDSNYNLSTGIYNITIKGTNASDYADLRIEIIEPEPIKININLNNGMASASASGGNGTYTFKWNTGDTASSITIEDKKTYTVTVTDMNGCTALKTIGTSGLNVAEMQSKEFSIYPNPLNNAADFSIEINAVSKAMATLQMFDLKGNQVGTWDINLLSGLNKEILSVRPLPSGVYMMTLKSDGFSGYKRVMVK